MDQNARNGVGTPIHIRDAEVRKALPVGPNDAKLSPSLPIGQQSVGSNVSAAGVDPSAVRTSSVEFEGPGPGMIGSPRLLSAAQP
jgi:hypothetical protein